MRVGFQFDPSPGTGIARYTHGLLQALGEAGPAACRVTAFALGKRDPRPAWLPPAVAYQGTRLPGKVQQLLYRRLGVPAETLFGLSDLNLLHTTDSLPAHTRLPWVMTVYDVAWRRLGPAYEAVVSREWTRLAEDAIRRARHLCAISEATARDLVDGGVPRARVSVTPLGVDDRFRAPPPAAVAALRARLALPDVFLLYVGAINARKNLAVVAAARRALAAPPPLLLAGPPPPEGLARWGLDGPGCRHLGYVPEEDLPALYAAASAVIVPSRLEGFGLPLLEAMAAGTPLLASDTPAVRETAGPAALYFEPDDAAALAAALERLLAAPDLRLELAAAGRERAAGFTWAACASATAAAYRAALGQAA